MPNVICVLRVKYRERIQIRTLGPKFNSTTAVAAEAGVSQALPAAAVVEFMAKWSDLCPGTVLCETEVSERY